MARARRWWPGRGLRWPRAGHLGAHCWRPRPAHAQLPAGLLRSRPAARTAAAGGRVRRALHRRSRAVRQLPAAVVREPRVRGRGWSWRRRALPPGPPAARRGVRRAFACGWGVPPATAPAAATATLRRAREGVRRATAVPGAALWVRRGTRIPASGPWGGPAARRRLRRLRASRCWRVRRATCRVRCSAAYCAVRSAAACRVRRTAACAAAAVRTAPATTPAWRIRWWVRRAGARVRRPPTHGSAGGWAELLQFYAAARNGGPYGVRRAPGAWRAARRWPAAGTAPAVQQ